MQPPTVVERFQVLEDGTPRYLSRGETPAMHEEFGLQGGDETLRHGIVQGTPRPSHRRNEADLLQAPAERDRRVLGAAIGMMYESRGWFAPPYRHLQGVDHELGPHVGVHRPTDDPSRVGVQDEGQVEKALLRRYVGDVRQPDPVRTTGNEVPAKQVRCTSGLRITAGGSVPLTPHTASKPCSPH